MSRPAYRDYGATSSNTTSTIATDLPTISYSGFSPTEFLSLSEDIACSIIAIKTSTKHLEKVLKKIGTPRFKQPTQRSIHNTNAITNSRITATSEDLQRLTSVVRRSDIQQKLQLEKLTTDFHTVIEYYSTVQKRVAAAIRQHYIQLEQQQQNAALMEDEESELQKRTDEIQEQQQMEAQLRFEQDMLLDRERQINQVEADILDVNAIMRKIGTLVHAQTEQVDRIETSIENASTEVELGREQLIKASAHRRSYSRKILIILAIAVIIGLIVTGIIVSKLIK